MSPAAPSPGGALPGAAEASARDFSLEQEGTLLELWTLSAGGETELRYLPARIASTLNRSRGPYQRRFYASDVAVKMDSMTRQYKKTRRMVEEGVIPPGQEHNHWKYFAIFLCIHNEARPSARKSSMSGDSAIEGRTSPLRKKDVPAPPTRAVLPNPTNIPRRPLTATPTHCRPEMSPLGTRAIIRPPPGQRQFIQSPLPAPRMSKPKENVTVKCRLRMRPPALVSRAQTCAGSDEAKGSLILRLRLSKPNGARIRLRLRPPAESTVGCGGEGAGEGGLDRTAKGDDADRAPSPKRRRKVQHATGSSAPRESLAARVSSPPDKIIPPESGALDSGIHFSAATSGNEPARPTVVRDAAWVMTDASPGVAGKVTAPAAAADILSHFSAIVAGESHEAAKRRLERKGLLLGEMRRTAGVMQQLGMRDEAGGLMRRVVGLLTGRGSKKEDLGEEWHGRWVERWMLFQTEMEQYRLTAISFNEIGQAEEARRLLKVVVGLLGREESKAL